MGSVRTDYSEKNYDLMSPASRDTTWFISATDVTAMPIVKNNWVNMSAYI
jgi:hypothetical protein